MSDIHHLYGAPCSLFTAKARSHLRKRGVAFDERGLSHPEFMIAVGRAGVMRLPILETPSGEIIQDTSMIIDHLEATLDAPPPALPEGPLRRLAARLFELYGDEGLLRPAMHYRWSFEDNRPFLTMEFGRMVKPDAQDAEAEAAGADLAKRFSGYLVPLGVTQDAAPLVEAALAEFLALFDAHLRLHPYVLGDAPTLADYALMGPLFGHLARDPHPSALMKRIAPRVFRWTEYMNDPAMTPSEYAGRARDAEEADVVPPTAVALLRWVMADFTAELIAVRGAFAEWVGAHPDHAPGARIDEKRDQPDIGEITFDYRGGRITALARAYMLWMLQRAQDDLAGLDALERMEAEAFLDDVGAKELLTTALARRLDRKENHLCVA